MKSIEFWKMSGSGNDFILIDNRNGKVMEKDMKPLVQRACRRRQSVGADGVIFVTASENYAFSWRYFNADGGEVEMCGNGSRCAARYAFLNGIAGKSMTFETLAGPLSAEVSGRLVKVLIPSPSDIRTDINIPFQPGWEGADFINAGVPHVVIRVQDLTGHPVVEQGRTIRYHSMFLPAGTNANFIVVRDTHHIEIRTYERGVEDETLACGTGAIASALIANIRGMASSPVSVSTKGGEDLKIYFDKEGNSFSKVWLEGTTSIVYKGKLNEEALV
jgi:diaminopimelate epimerase